MGLFDGLGGMSAGEGYVDPSDSSQSISPLQILKSILGPTQAEAAAGGAKGPNYPTVSKDQAAALAQQYAAGQGAQTAPTLAPYGYGGGGTLQTAPDGPSADPQIVELSPDEARAALAQQNAQNAPPPAVAATTPGAAQGLPAQPPVASGPVDTPLPQNGGPSDYTVNADGSVSSTTDPNSFQPNPNGGGLISQLSASAQDPTASKSLLDSFAQQARGVADKLTNLSPNAAQALLASGLTMLANNDGRHNLSQLIGEGGISGINNYQSNVQMQAQNALARQKLAQDLYNKQQENAVNAYKAQTDRYKPENVQPGNSIQTAGGIINGQAPQGPSQLPIKQTVPVQGPDGKMYEQGIDIFGKPVGQPILKDDPLNDNVPLTAPQQTVINGAQNDAAIAKINLGKTTNYIQKLSPTMIDANGKEVDNPNYVALKGGVFQTLDNALSKVTGNYDEAQQLRQQITQEVTKTDLGQYKQGVGGRLTNTDVGILQKGLPMTNVSGDTLRNYLISFGRLQQSMADEAEKKAAFVSNSGQRGDATALRRPLQYNGVTYPAGTSYSDFVSGKAPTQTQSAPSGGSPTASAPVVNSQAAQGAVARVIAAAKAGNQDAINALNQRGIKWQ